MTKAAALSVVLWPVRAAMYGMLCRIFLGFAGQVETMLGFLAIVAFVGIKTQRNRYRAMELGT